jgi:hypothetical protein
MVGRMLSAMRATTALMEAMMGKSIAPYAGEVKLRRTKLLSAEVSKLLLIPRPTSYLYMSFVYT